MIKEKVQNILNEYEQLKKEINSFSFEVSEYSKSIGLKNDYSPYHCEPEIEIYDDFIIYNWSQGCGRGCCSDYYNFSYPVWYLYVSESEWKADLDKQAKEIQERLRLEKEKLRQEELESKRKQLEALKKELECQE